jgi:hypothetical protein
LHVFSIASLTYLRFPLVVTLKVFLVMIYIFFHSYHIPHLRISPGVTERCILYLLLWNLGYTSEEWRENEKWSKIKPARPNVGPTNRVCPKVVPDGSCGTSLVTWRLAAPVDAPDRNILDGVSLEPLPSYL